MLVGRDAEATLLEQMLARATQGQSASMLISGDPGIGKSTLLRHVEERALEANFTVLKATGVEAESQIPYAALSDLIKRPRTRSTAEPESDPGQILALLDRLPQAQIDALASALAVPRVVAKVRPPGESGEGTAPVNVDRFAVAAATLSLLAAAAETSPVLCVVDDAQWIDASSAEALSFTARRLQAEGVVMLFAVRTEAPGAARFIGIATDTMELRGLDPAAARLLLDRAGDAALHESVLNQVLATAGGNPLALLELPGALKESERVRKTPIRSPLPLGPTLERAFTGRILRLPDATQRALHILAASDLTLTNVVTNALTRGGSSVTDLDAAEDDGLVTIDALAVTFRHPLMRSAAYQCAKPAERREAHRLLAETLAELNDVPQALERKVWHLVAATVAPDDDVAAALEEAARQAASQRSFGIAATLYERSATLSVSTDARPPKLFAAGLAAIPAGWLDESIRLLSEALALTAPSTARVRIEHQLCELMLWRQAPLTARDRLLELAAEVEDSERGLAAAIVLSAAQASIVMYDQPGVAAAAQWATELAGGESGLLLASSIIRAFAEAQAGHGGRAATILDECRSALEAQDSLAKEQVMLQAGVCNLALERFSEARPLLERVVTEARSAGAGGSLAMQLPWLALLDLSDGHWIQALAEAHEALHLIEETGWDTYRPTGLSVLARVEAGMGRPECVGHAQSAIDAALKIGARPLAAHAHAAIGLYHLGQQAWEAAVKELEEALRLADFSAAPLLRVQFLPDLIEANARAAHKARAAELLADLTLIANEMRRPSTLALAARCRGLVDTQNAQAHFMQSLADGSEGREGLAAAPFEQARTSLYYGEVLRRAKRRSEARKQFGRAHEEFQRLGAVPWAARASKWLEGGGAAPQENSALQLTPQELQVALAVSKGMSNPQVAASLFLSVKTVEYHLRHVFDKVGVRSRTQLVGHMSQIAPELVLPGER